MIKVDFFFSFFKPGLLISPNQGYEVQVYSRDWSGGKTARFADKMPLNVKDWI